MMTSIAPSASFQSCATSTFPALSHLTPTTSFPSVSQYHDAKYSYLRTTDSCRDATASQSYELPSRGVLRQLDHNVWLWDPNASPTSPSLPNTTTTLQDPTDRNVLSTTITPPSTPRLRTNVSSLRPLTTSFGNSNSSIGPSQSTSPPQVSSNFSQVSEGISESISSDCSEIGDSSSFNDYIDTELNTEKNGLEASRSVEAANAKFEANHKDDGTTTWDKRLKNNSRSARKVSFGTPSTGAHLDDREEIKAWRLKKMKDLKDSLHASSNASSHLQSALSQYQDQLYRLEKDTTLSDDTYRSNRQTILGKASVSLRQTIQDTMFLSRKQLKEIQSEFEKIQSEYLSGNRGINDDLANSHWKRYLRLERALTKSTIVVTEDGTESKDIVESVWSEFLKRTTGGRRRRGVRSDSDSAISS